ncbi:unnamed protein product [Rotaria sordida]|uniref:Uncharacterized protein n=1 Tax=Rotaria sordida TaxID=392033 RepID=A0A815A1E1_9BILA|nr:unnamed protein product [Rotaria sordida]CAF3607634.1 unnamed protein product [Rotaria sordida]
MTLSKFVTDETPVVIVSLNISDTNGTINGNFSKVFMKRPRDDTSINNIIFGIGLVVVILLLLLIIIKLIYKCYKMYQDDSDDEKEKAKRSPLLPSSSSQVVRRNSSIRNPTPSIRRSSLNIETQMDIQRARLSQTYSDTPPVIKKS